MTAATALKPFVGVKTVLLTSYRRDGAGVATPVSIAVGDDHAFFRTFDKAWKAKRLRRNPNVEIAPSTFRGKQIGPAIHARVRLLKGDEARRARRMLARRHPVLQGLLVPLLHRMMRYQTLHYELTPVVDQRLPPRAPNSRDQFHG
jgi:PPOX class probable F420-dependent enzyme